MLKHLGLYKLKRQNFHVVMVMSTNYIDLIILTS